MADLSTMVDGLRLPNPLVIASGPPAEIRANRAVQDAYLGAPAEIARC